MKVKEYKISTLKDIVNVVTPENMDNFLIDLRMWFQRVQKDNGKLKLEISFKGISAQLLDPTSFVWIDDGKHVETKVSLDSTGKEIKRERAD